MVVLTSVSSGVNVSLCVEVLLHRPGEGEPGPSASSSDRSQRPGISSSECFPPRRGGCDRGSDVAALLVALCSSDRASGETPQAGLAQGRRRGTRRREVRDGRQTGAAGSRLLLRRETAAADDARSSPKRCSASSCTRRRARMFLQQDDDVLGVLRAEVDEAAKDVFRQGAGCATGGPEFLGRRGSSSISSRAFHSAVISSLAFLKVSRSSAGVPCLVSPPAVSGVNLFRSSVRPRRVSPLLLGPRSRAESSAEAAAPAAGPVCSMCRSARKTRGRCSGTARSICVCRRP